MHEVTVFARHGGTVCLVRTPDGCDAFAPTFGRVTIVTEEGVLDDEEIAAAAADHAAVTDWE